jgi:fatty acid desaturase
MPPSSTAPTDRPCTDGRDTTPHLLVDPRVRSVAWKDLTKLTRAETVRELALSLPWLAASLYLAGRGLYPLALLASFVFFLTGLRQAHDAHHYNLGLSRAATEWVLFALSVLMLGSMHAVQFNHLRHHRHCLDDDDVEARSARMRWWQALLWGPVFPVLLHKTALAKASRRKLLWMYGELLANAAVVGAVAFVWPARPLCYHLLAMAAGHCLTAFFAVWTVHHDCDASREVARTLRNPLKSAVAFDMFFHVEHHLFPRVPTRHLPELARRLDRIAPELGRKQVY